MYARSVRGGEALRLAGLGELGVVGLLGSGDHQLDTVELIGLGGTRIVIDGDDVGFLMQTTNLAEHATAGHMVGQAGERLRADHIRATLFDKLQNLGRQQPAPHRPARRWK